MTVRIGCMEHGFGRDRVEGCDGCRDSLRLEGFIDQDQDPHVVMVSTRGVEDAVVARSLRDPCVDRAWPDVTSSG